MAGNTLILSEFANTLIAALPIRNMSYIFIEMSASLLLIYASLRAKTLLVMMMSDEDLKHSYTRQQRVYVYCSV